ncbi:hypothetical protein [Paracoccus xiamenensis]|uniref:hypothetical protein n=1 Tax=Paracoccus xiamenensis TaxID=2714901 RepID=UPI00140C5841|nr:hypothetical protein [Paracoccus xiamenensis]NHF73155.1 hypothetical protein [Paracoccus xiamenensis]
MRIENNLQFYSSAKAPTARLEQAFLEEMMKYAFPQVGAAGFSGGLGEDQFASFMNREYAQMLATRIELGVEEVDHG